MKHYGDITKLSGYDLPVVDVITGGSPCQDLSVAGKRAGLAGERSGLFMEQMRIVAENKPSVLISIRPNWCALIANGRKTIEVRKTRPNLLTPFKCYIYCTKAGCPLVYGDRPCAGGWAREYCQTCGYSREEAERIWDVLNGKVIGEFICDRIFDISLTDEEYVFDVLLKMTGLTYEELESYLDRKTGYGWNISKLLIYDKPKELSEFRRHDPTYDFSVNPTANSASPKNFSNHIVISMLIFAPEPRKE